MTLIYNNVKDVIQSYPIDVKCAFLYAAKQGFFMSFVLSIFVHHVSVEIWFDWPRHYCFVYKYTQTEHNHRLKAYSKSDIKSVPVDIENTRLDKVNISVSLLIALFWFYFRKKIRNDPDCKII